MLEFLHKYAMTNPIRLRPIAPVAFVIIFGACDKTASSNRAVTEQDSAGVTLVTNHPPYPSWHVSESSLVRIGLQEGEAPYQLHDVRFAARLSDGRLVVIDGGSQEIRWYSPSGIHRSTLGRRGEGPGEFSDLRSATLTRGDSLVVVDIRNQRIIWVSPDENVLREDAIGVIGTPDKRLLGIGSDVRLRMANYRPTYSIERPGFNLTRDSLLLLAYSHSGADSVVRLAGDENATWVRFDGGRPTQMMQWGLAFGYQTLTGSTREHFVVADGDQGHVQLLGSDGSLVRIARRSDLTRQPITEAHRDLYVEHVVEAARTRGRRDLAAVEQGRRDEMKALPEGHTVPLFDRLLVDTADRIWLRDFAPDWLPRPTQVWTVYEPDGQITARVSVPARLEVTHVGSDHLTGVEHDELDVQTVVVYSIGRR